MKQEDATFPRKIHQFVAVVFFYLTRPSGDEKAVSSPGFAFCLHFSRWQRTIKRSFFGPPWSHRNCQAAISVSLFSVLPIAVSPATILNFCHFDSHWAHTASLALHCVKKADDSSRGSVLPSKASHTCTACHGVPRQSIVSWEILNVKASVSITIK